ncbi:MAG: peptidoglycan DD-metalloendopeptidase family protein [Ruminococcus sp.]|nr:peptidoglycan DD-metalloendopeptidase family protein [Ruminococcus sp.]
MGTKFIGIDGYGKIASVNQKKQSKNNINNKASRVYKLVRFSKRLAREIGKDMKAVGRKIGDITWPTLTPGKFFRGVRNFHISGSYFEFMRSPKGIATMAAPVLAAMVLILTVCFWTCSDKPLTVSVDGEYIATIENDQVLTQASVQMNHALSDVPATNKSTPAIQVSYPSFAEVETASAADVYEMMVVQHEEIIPDADGLYVDGVFYGATTEVNALATALEGILADAKAGYDDATVTSFNNDVQISTDVYATADIKTAAEIIDAARSSFSIRLETDYVVEEEIAYSTITETDDTQLDTYSEVKTQGSNGLKEVSYRLVYVDGVQTDAVFSSETVITEAVDEVVVVGTQESYQPTGDFIWPVPYTSNVTSHYKWRWGRMHNGIDIADSGCYGVDIVASDAGTVEWAGWDSSGYGNYVIIDHGNGYKTLYGHCCEVYVSIGDKVNQGDVVGAMGATGNVTGTHLHFEIIENGVKVDPYPYIS